MDKVKKNLISITHLSDMIRLCLLYTYGGTWIDATVFVSQDIPEWLHEESLFSIKIGMDTKEPSHGRWTTFLLFGQKGNILIKQALDYHYQYWMEQYNN